MATAKSTTDRDEIRTWVEERGGHPAHVKSTGTRNDPGVLRIDFPGYSGEDTLEAMEWDEFFEWFDRDNLALLISEEEGNRFNKLVTRETPAPTRRAAAASRKRAGSVSSRKAVRSSSKAASTKGGSSASKKAASARKASSAKKGGASSSKKAAAPRKASSAKKGGASASKKRVTSSTKKATPAKKASSSSKKASTTKKAASSTKKASSSSTKKASSSKKATASRKAPSKRATNTRTSSTKKASPSRKATASRKTSNKSAKRATASAASTDHNEIRKWVEARGGFPAHVRQTGRKRGDLGVLRIDYPGYSGKDTLERVDWEDWFAAFDRNKLAFLHDKKRNSRFSKLVNR